jgi:hypothetical protein
MARRLEQFPRVQGNAKYPWDEWLDGSPWQLTPGEDIEAKRPTVLTSARAQAKRRGGNVRTRTLVNGGRETVVIQFRRG